MLKVENVETYGWEAAFRGMRNPKNSWSKSDSEYKAIILDDADEQELCKFQPTFVIGENDMKLAKTLAGAGPVHGKFLRMIGISMDITAPLFFLKEWDTYKIGTVRNSCSTMHKIMEKEFSLSDFSFDIAKEQASLHDMGIEDCHIHSIMTTLNTLRDRYLKEIENGENEKAKITWRTLIEFLPSSYNQKSTVTMNYEVARNMYFYRRNHKLIEWHTFCNELEKLPYAREFIMEGYKCQQ